MFEIVDADAEDGGDEGSAASSLPAVVAALSTGGWFGPYGSFDELQTEAATQGVALVSQPVPVQDETQQLGAPQYQVLYRRKLKPQPDVPDGWSIWEVMNNAGETLFWAVQGPGGWLAEAFDFIETAIERITELVPGQIPRR